jgi:hypothetical protein
MAIVAAQTLAFGVTAKFYKNGVLIGYVTLPANTPAYTVISSAEFLFSSLGFAVDDVLTLRYSTSDGSALPAGAVSALVRWNIDRATRKAPATANLANAELSGAIAALLEIRNAR